MTDQDPIPLWRYIRLDEFSKPKEPTQETVRKGVLGFLKKLRRTPSQTEPAISHADLHVFHLHVLDKVVSPPDWHEQFSALNVILEDWLKLTADQDRFSAQIIVGAPYSGTSQGVTHWATTQKWRIIEPPGIEQILEGGKDWLSQLDTDKNMPMVIPSLERFYLRHHEGLTLIRRLLDWLWNNKCRCLIGCDSWAWTYLCKALRIDSLFPNPFILEAFDHERLQRWFQSLSLISGKECFVFRQTDNGKFVIPPKKPLETPGNKDIQTEKPLNNTSKPASVTNFLNNVASYSRGIPGVAWAIWRCSLRRTPDDDVLKNILEEIETDRCCTLWVIPWSHLNLPIIQYTKNQKQLFVLHALLLHAGLPVQLLSQLLSIPDTELIQILHQLKNSGILDVERGIWRVTPLGYPAVRQFLNSEGYLADVI